MISHSRTTLGAVNQPCHGRGAGGWGGELPPKYWAVGKFCLLDKSKDKNSGMKTPILEKFGDKIKILSTHNLLCVKFAVVCRKIAESLLIASRQKLLTAPSTSITHNTAAVNYAKSVIA